MRAISALLLMSTFTARIIPNCDARQRTQAPCGKVVQSGEAIGKGKPSRWRIEVQRKKDRERKMGEKRKKRERPLGCVTRGKGKGVAVFGMIAAKPHRQAKREDALRKYITRHVPGTFLTFEQRQTPAADWNRLVGAGCRVTIRPFAARHGPRPETWRREYLRGATGAAVPDPRVRRRRKYAEYDPFAAQDKINENNANKGARMLMTNRMATSFNRMKSLQTNGWRCSCRRRGRGGRGGGFRQSWQARQAAR